MMSEWIEYLIVIAPDGWMIQIKSVSREFASDLIQIWHDCYFLVFHSNYVAPIPPIGRLATQKQAETAAYFLGGKS